MKLRMIYDKRKGKAIVKYPPGITTDGDAKYLYAFFSKEFSNHMKRLGYDLKSLKFEIAPAKGKRRFTGHPGPLIIFKCSCGFEFLDVIGTPYCPECGERDEITQTER